MIPIVATQSISSRRSVLGSGEAWRTLLSWRAFLMALAVLAALPATYAAGIHYIITVRDGSPFILLPVALSFPFVLRALIRGWLRRPPRERPTGASDPGRAGLDRPGGSRRLLTAIRP